MSLPTATSSPTPTQLPSQTPTQPPPQTTTPPTTVPTVGGVAVGAIAGGMIGGLIGAVIIILIIFIVAYLVWRWNRYYGEHSYIPTEKPLPAQAQEGVRVKLFVSETKQDAYWFNTYTKQILTPNIHILHPS